MRPPGRRWSTRWPKMRIACLAFLDDRQLGPGVAQAAELLATVVGQDLETSDDGIFRIARKVAKDRVISVVDPDARHGHKTSARSFDGYKGHVAVDPDSEIITATAVTAGNAGDAERRRGSAGRRPAHPGNAGNTDVAEGDCSDSQDDSNLGTDAGTTTAAGAATQTSGPAWRCSRYRQPC